MSPERSVKCRSERTFYRFPFNQRVIDGLPHLARRLLLNPATGISSGTRQPALHLTFVSPKPFSRQIRLSQKVRSVL
jgi:hypothetical protein